MFLFYRLLIGCIQSLAIGVSVGHKYTSKYCEVIAGFFFRIPSLSRIARIIGRSGLAKTSRNPAMLVNNEWVGIDCSRTTYRGGMQLRILNNEKTYCMASMHNAHDVYAFFMFSIVPTYFCGLVQRK